MILFGGVMKFNWHKWFSLGILNRQESANCRRWGNLFDFIMLLVVFWLPLQWYLENINGIGSQAVLVANWIIWAIFVLELVVMLSLVNHKKYYLQSNWLNILIIIAIFPPWWFNGSTYFALLRYIRVIVLLRLIVPQFYYLHRILSRNHFGYTLLVFLIVTVFSGILVTYIDPGIGSLGNGIWWAWQTVTTVGYGDSVPNTALGKLFAAVLMLGGVGLFSLVSANLAAYFIERGRKQDKKPEKHLQREFNDITARLERLERKAIRID